MARSEDRDRKRRLNGMMKDLQMIDPSEILPYLTCLSPMRKEQIRARCRNDGPMIAAAELMEELPKREGWYDILVKALRDIEKHELADKLEGPELRSSPSGPSQEVATGKSFQSAQQQTPSPPANDPKQRQPEPEASATPGYPSRAEEKDVQRKGEAEKEVNNSEVDENAGQQPPLGASLPIPIQEMRQSTPASGSAASSPSRDLQGHDESESDECNTSPLTEGRSAQMRRRVVGEAEELAENKMLPGNASRAMDAGAVGVSVHPREVSVRQRDDSAVGVSVGPRESEQDKHPHIQIPRNHPNNHGKQNNLSPAIGSREINRNLDQTNYVEAHNEGSIRDEERQMTGTHSLSSSGVDPRHARAVSSISESEILDGISRESTASQSGTCLQQNEDVSVRPRDDGAVDVSGHPRDVSGHSRDDGLTGREAARGRMEDEKLKRKEVGKGEDEWRNIPSESEQEKSPHIQIPRNHPNNHGKQNNLSPAIDSREFNRSSDQTAYFKAPNVGSIREEERLMTGTHSLSSSGVDPRIARAVSSISESEILDGISDTASQSGTCLQQNEGNTESNGEVQGGADKSGTGERGAIGGVDASNDNQDSLIMRMGTVVRAYIPNVRGYIPSVLNSVGERILKP